jgi:hypothetical protein
MEIVKIYREALRPSVGIYLIISLLIPIIILTAAPFSLPLGIALAAVISLGISVTLNAVAPRIEVNSDSFRAGKATIERKFIGSVSAFSGEHAREQRGVKLDARAWTLIRGYVDPVVKVELTDPNDPTPYWLVSTRRPKQLAQALRTSRQ